MPNKAGKTHIYSPGDLVLAQMDDEDGSPKQIGIILEPSRMKWSGKPCWRIMVGEEIYIFFESELILVSACLKATS